MSPLRKPTDQARSSRKQYSTAQWDSRKSQIEQLYVNEGRSLKEVISAMDKEGFHPNERMYKFRFEKWGFGKNLTKKRYQTLSTQLEVNKECHGPKAMTPERVSKYLKRKKWGESTTPENMEVSDWSPGENPEQMLENSMSDSSENSLSDFNGYEEGCPYDKWGKIFRVIETFSDDSGTCFIGDSFGDHAYIDAADQRPCTVRCSCRGYKRPQPFIFTVSKTETNFHVTIHSDALLLELQTLKLENWKQTDEKGASTIDGFILLKNYRCLRAHLDTLRYTMKPNQLSILLDIDLLVSGLLGDSSVFQSFGFQRLKRQGILDYEVWMMFLRQSYRKDINRLDHEFKQADTDLESPTPNPANSEYFGSMGRILPPELQRVERHCRASRQELSRYITYGDVKRVEELLTAGVNIEGRISPNNLGGLSPLFEAVKSGQSDVVQTLISYGASPYAWFNKRDGGDNIYITALYQGVLDGHVEIVRSLLAKGYNLNFGANIYRYNYSLSGWVKEREHTPLYEAAGGGQAEIASLLLDHGANVNAGAKEVNRCMYETPLFSAAKNGHIDVVKFLVSHGADVNKGHYSVQTGAESPAMVAEQNGHTEIAEFLHSKEEEIRVAQNGLFEAAKAGNLADARFYLESGADINGMTSNGTALSAAAGSNHSQMTFALLQQGADIQDATFFLKNRGNKSGLRLLSKMASCTPVLPRVTQNEPQKSRDVRHLRICFIGEYQSMMRAALKSSTSFRSILQKFPNHRAAWELGIRTMRMLSQGEQPLNLDHTIAFLCLAKSIVETLKDNGDADYHREFFNDLRRWQELFSEEDEKGAYKEAMLLMWAAKLDTIEDCDAEVLIKFQQLASTLVSQATSLLLPEHRANSSGYLEKSQRRWRLNNESEFGPSNASSSKDSSPTTSHEVIQEKPGEILINPPDILLPSHAGLAIDEMANEPPVENHIAVLLMAGAIFAIVIVFLQDLRSAALMSSTVLVGAAYIGDLAGRIRVWESYMGMQDSRAGYQHQKFIIGM